MPTKAAALLIAVCLCSSTLMPVHAAEPPKAKLPAPDAAAQEEVLATIRDTYQDDYKKPDKSALAKMLIQKAKETQDTTDRFVLLREAQNVAAEALQVPLAVEAIDAMASEYDVSPLEMKAEVIEKAAEKARKPEQKKAVAEAALEIVDEAVSEDNFDVAKKVGRQAVRFTKERELLQRVVAKNKEVEAAAKAYANAKEAMTTLKEKPDEPDANATVGKYLCLSKGDWEKGLPMLVLGSDERLKVLAENDIAGAASSDEQKKLGDAWWEVSKERAAYWYEQALPGLAGLEKDRVEKRLGEMRDKENQRLPRQLDLLKLIDLKRDVVSGNVAFEKSCLIVSNPPGYGGAVIQVPYKPPKEYRLTLTLERIERRKGAFAIIVPIGGRRVGVAFDSLDAQFFGLDLVDGAHCQDSKNPTGQKNGPYIGQKPTKIICLVGETSVKVWLNGKLLLDWTGDVGRLSSDAPIAEDHLGLAACATSGAPDPYRIHSMLIDPVDSDTSRTPVQGKPR